MPHNRRSAFAKTFSIPRFRAIGAKPSFSTATAVCNSHAVQHADRLSDGHSFQRRNYLIAEAKFMNTGNCTGLDANPGNTFTRLRCASPM